MALGHVGSHFAPITAGRKRVISRPPSATPIARHGENWQDARTFRSRLMPDRKFDGESKGLD